MTASTPLVTSKARDESKQKWDADDSSGLRTVKQGVVNVEYRRDVQPILARSCAACHTGSEPAGKLNLAADEEAVNVENQGKFPGTYVRLALDERGKFGHKPVGYDSWGYPQASRYIRKFQSRRSLLAWKIFGKRLDGFSNDDHPSETSPGSGELAQAGKPVELAKNRYRYDVDFTGSMMPPPDAVAGKYKGVDGKPIKVAPLSEEDRRTLVRWIDLGCPIDLDFDPARPDERGFGWMCDDNRPVLTIAQPRAGQAEPVTRIVIGMADYYSGLDESTFNVTSSVAIDGVAAGENLASRFKNTSPGVWELKLSKPLPEIQAAEIIASVKDKQGNMTRLVRPFSAK